MARQFTAKALSLTLVGAAVGLVVFAGITLLGSHLLREGHRVAYIVNASSDGPELFYCRDGSSRELVAYNLATQQKRVVAKTSALVFPYVRLSPKAGWIGVVYDHTGRGTLRYLSESLTPEKEVLDFEFSDTLPSLSPTDNAIVFVRARKPRTDAWGGAQWTDLDLYKSPLQHPQSRRLTQLSAVDISRPCVGPKADRIVFSRRLARQNDDVFTLDVRSGSLRQLIPSGPTNRDPVFSSDGSRIAFASDRSRQYQYEVWTMDRNGGQLRQVTSMKRRCIAPLFLPGSRSLAFVVDESELWVVNEDGSHLRRVE